MYSPYRANLPTYTILSVDYDKRRCVVSVPADSVPADDTLRAILFGSLQLRHGVSTALRDAATAAWYELLDEQYSEHAGRFRPIPG